MTNQDTIETIEHLFAMYEIIYARHDGTFAQFCIEYRDDLIERVRNGEP